MQGPIHILLYLYHYSFAFVSHLSQHMIFLINSFQKTFKSSNKVFSPDSIVGIKARLRIRRFGIRIPAISFLSQERLWGPQAIPNEKSGGFRSGIKQPGREVEHSPSPSAGGGNEWS